VFWPPILKTRGEARVCALTLHFENMRMTKIFPLAVLLLGMLAPAAFPQSADDIKSLRRDIDAVRDSQKVIQNDIADIKKILEQGGPPSGGAPQAFKETVLSIEGAPMKGDKDAKVTLIEFTDFQCPFCGRSFQQVYPQIYDEYVKTGKVKYVLRDFPLESIHPFAFKAAVAARCGGEQGKYWEMREKLFTNQTALAADDLVGYAKAVGLDGAKFKACVDSGKQDAKIRSDMAEGQKAGVTGTPGFLLGLTQPNETKITAVKNIVGAQPFSSFKDAIDSLLQVAAK
jgi:protein-disulfide isomerase